MAKDPDPRRPEDLPARLGRGMLFAAWAAGIALLALFFQRFLDQENNPNRDLRLALDAEGRAQVVLQRNRAGHYVARGSIDGHPVDFLLDTGATDVALPLSVAQRLGLTLGPWSTARTANGDVRVWTTRLDSVDLGGLTLRRVPASVLPNMTGDEVLLGMSYLKQFELLQRGDTLTLRAPGTPAP